MREALKRQAGKWLMAAGAILLSSAVLLTAGNIYSDRQAAKRAGEILSALDAGDETQGNGNDALPDPDMEMPVRVVDGKEYIGVLEIPELGLRLPVMSNWSMEDLKTAPCRYSGTAYKSGFVIAGHNYQAHFGELKDLAEGAEIRFMDVLGNDFVYKAVKTETLEPEETERMTDDRWDLSLFTCTYSGAARCTVRCEKILWLQNSMQK